MSNEKELQARQKAQDRVEPSALTEQVDQPQRAEDGSRRRFVFKLGMFGATAAVFYAKPDVTYAQSCPQLSPSVINQPLTGTGDLEGGTCTVMYSYTGSIQFIVLGSEIQISSLLFNGTFVSGPQTFGDVTLQNNGTLIGPINGAGDFNINGAQLLYSDTILNTTPVVMDIGMSGGSATGSPCALGFLNITSTGPAIPNCPVPPFGSMTSKVEAE